MEMLMKVIHNRLIKNNDRDTYHTYISIYIYTYRYIYMYMIYRHIHTHHQHRFNQSIKISFH